MMVNASQMKRWLLTMRSVESAIMLTLFVMALAYFNLTVFYSFDLSDEGYLLFNIRRVANGEIPHRDFTEVYGPGFYALTAPVYRAFGDRVLALRELLAVFRAATVVFAYLIARHFVPRPFAVFAAIVSMAHWGWFVWSLNTPYAAVFTIPLCTFSLVLLLNGEKRGDRRAYVWSGFVCGMALLVKWSLAAVSAYGMVLAICARAMLREHSVPGPRAHRTAIVLAAAVVGSAIVLPFRSKLTPFDYLLHFAPIHTLLAVVSFRFARYGDGRSFSAQATPLVARYCAGFLVAPLLVAALYLSWGSLGDLYYNMVTRPLSYRNYQQPIRLPSLDSLALMSCIAAWIAAGFAFLRSSRRSAISFLVLGALLAPFGLPEVQRSGDVSLGLERLQLHLPAITSFAAVALIAAALARRNPFESERSLNALVAAVFFQEMMTFQIYPRGGFNVTMMLGTLAPIIAYLSYRCYSIGMNGITSGPLFRRLTAFILAALLPALFLGQKVRSAVSAPCSHTPSTQVALHVPSLAGIRPKRDPFARTHPAAFAALIRHLEWLPPGDAPIFVLQNEPMIYFATGRDHLFEEHALIFFLAGWNILPASDRGTPSSDVIIERLTQVPDAIIVARLHDETVENFNRHFPEAFQHISENYRVVKAIGHYRVLNRIPAE
jgi:hypothetical protein